MMTMLFLTTAIFISSFVGTIAGFGSSTVILPVMLFFMPYVPAQFFVAVLHLFGDVWKMIFFRKASEKPWLLIIAFASLGSVLSYFGALLSVQAPDVLFRLFGFFLLLYTGLVLWEPTFRAKRTYPVAIIGGGITGFCAGLFGIRGAIRSAFLHAFALSPYSYLFATGATSLSVDIARIIGYMHGNGVHFPFDIHTLPLFLLASLFGAIAGRFVVQRFPRENYRRFVALLLALLALRLIFF